MQGYYKYSQEPLGDVDDSKPKDYYNSSSDWWRAVTSKVKATIGSATQPSSPDSTSSEEAMSTPSGSPASTKASDQTERSFDDGEEQYGGGRNAIPAYTSSASKSMVQWKRQALTTVSSPFVSKSKTE